jgi:cytidylate kinase
MQVMTISREHGSGGSRVAELVAQGLGWRCVDMEIVERVANAVRRPVSEVEELDENPDHAILRAMKRLVLPGLSEVTYNALASGLVQPTVLPNVPEPESDGKETLPVLDEDAYAKLTRAAIEAAAEQGGTVIVGRGSQAILSGRKDTVHVRVCAPEEERCKMLGEREGIDPDEAMKRIRSTDAQRRRYLSRHYNLDWTDTSAYHLIVNTGRTGIDGAAELLTGFCSNA